MTTSRDDAYKGDTNYDLYNELANKINMIKKITNKTIIDFIIDNKIDVETYLPGENGVNGHTGGYYPIIYLASKYQERETLVDWLLDKGAKPSRIPDVDNKHQLDLYFQCDSIYINKFSSIGVKFINENKQIEHSIIYGKYNRLILLTKENIIKHKFIRRIINKGKLRLSKEILASAVKNLAIICECSERVNPAIIRNKVHNIMNQCAQTFAFIISYGYKPDLIILQIAVAYYLVPVVSILTKYINKTYWDDIIILHHKALDPLMVAAQRQMYNDGKYAAICRLLGRDVVLPDGGYRQVQKKYRKELIKMKRMCNKC